MDNNTNENTNLQQWAKEIGKYLEDGCQNSPNFEANADYFNQLIAGDVKDYSSVQFTNDNPDYKVT